MEGLEKADIIVFYFDPCTKAPVSMMELGLCFWLSKVIVCCTKGYWRKGNVEIVCRKYKVSLLMGLLELVTLLELEVTQHLAVST